MTRLTLLLLATAQRAAAADATCGGGDRARGRYPSIVIGCWQILERHDDEDAAVATLSAYMDAGFTTFDTADIYGQSERVLGRLRAKYAGDATPVIFTKYVTHRVSKPTTVWPGPEGRLSLWTGSRSTPRPRRGSSVEHVANFSAREPSTTSRGDDAGDAGREPRRGAPRQRKLARGARRIAGDGAVPLVGLFRSALRRRRVAPRDAARRGAARRGGRVQL